METTELLKKVRKIEIKSRGLTNHIFAGEYHSAFKGRGMTFSEVREYQYGDDIRNIDWNVTARYNTPFVKIFEEERELTVMLLIDVSNSRFFGSTHQLKMDLMTEIGAVLSFSAIQNNDKIGVIFFSDKIEKFIPPQKGKKHILRIIRELIEFKPSSNKTNIAEALKFLTNGIKKRSTAFILSDFIDFNEGDSTQPNYLEAMRIAGNKHDVVAIRVFDKREAALPAVGLLKVKDAETGADRWIDTDSRFVRDGYAEWWRKSTAAVNEVFSKSRVDSVTIATDEDYVQPLVKLFKRR